LLGVAFLEPHRDTLRRRLLARLGQHLRREIDAADAMAATGQFQAQKPGAAADVERIETAAPTDHQVEDAVPRGALAVVRMLCPKSASNPAARRPQCAATCCLTGS